MTDLGKDVEYALLRKYYGLDPGELTLSQFKGLLLSIPKIEKLFRGTGETQEDHLQWCNDQLEKQSTR